MADNDNMNDKQPTQFDDIDEPNPEEETKKDEQMSEDNDTPFSPPDDIQDKIDDTQQEADINVDPHEWYDEGIEEATQTDPPNLTKANEYDPFAPGTEADSIQERDKEVDEDKEGSEFD